MKSTITALTALFLGTGAIPSDLHAADKYDTLRNIIAGTNGNQANFLNDAIATLRPLFRGRDYFERSDVDLANKIGKARQNAGLASQYLNFDLNGDFEVTRDEVESFFGYQFGPMGNSDEMRKKQLTAQVDQIMAADKNSDGKITGTEFSTALLGMNQGYEDPGLKIARALIDVDPNQDAKITQTELLQILANVSNGYGDAVKKQQQTVQDQKIKQTTANEAPAVACGKQTLSKNAKIAFVNLYEGANFSPIAVAGQDEVTKAVDIVIEDGSDPMALVLVSAKSVIWHFKGAVGRVEKIVTETDFTGSNVSGVVGVDRAKIVFEPSKSCLHYQSSRGIADQAISKGKVAQIFDRPADSGVFVYSSRIIQLPSGKTGDANRVVAGGGGIVVLRSDQPYAKNRNELEKPDNISLEDVVSAAKAEKYEVLPLGLGLSQLIAEGKLEKMRNGFRILKKIRFPAGLAGGSDYQFLLAKDVPKPDGKPGPACVVKEDTGEQVQGSCDN